MSPAFGDISEFFHCGAYILSRNVASFWQHYEKKVCLRTYTFTKPRQFLAGFTRKIRLTRTFSQELLKANFNNSKMFCLAPTFSRQSAQKNWAVLKKVRGVAHIFATKHPEKLDIFGKSGAFYRESVKTFLTLFKM